MAKNASGDAAGSVERSLGAAAEITADECERTLHTDTAQPVGIGLFAVPQDDDARRFGGGTRYAANGRHDHDER